jgi:hypothetical protein
MVKLTLLFEIVRDRPGIWAMNTDLKKRTGWVLLGTVLTLAIPLTQAAKPAGTGGGGSNNEEAAAVDPPEFYWSSFDYVQRILTLQGKDLISGTEGAPVFPTVYIGGEPVLFDQSGSAAITDFVTNEGPLLVPLDNILESLEGPASPPILRAIEGGDSWEIKAVTSTGTALFSAYFPRTIKDVPPDIGVCPCATEFSVYDKDNEAPGATFCSATQGISTDEYIEAGYGKNDGSAVIIGSHRSWSSEPLYTSTCYARDLSQIVGGEEQPQYLGSSPLQVGDGDHAICVALIMSIEAACSP